MNNNAKKKEIASLKPQKINVKISYILAGLFVIVGLVRISFGNPITKLNGYKMCALTGHDYLCPIGVEFNNEETERLVESMYSWDTGRLYIKDRNTYAIVNMQIQSGPEYHGLYYRFYEDGVLVQTIDDSGDKNILGYMSLFVAIAILLFDYMRERKRLSMRRAIVIVSLISVLMLLVFFVMWVGASIGSNSAPTLPFE